MSQLTTPMVLRSNKRSSILTPPLSSLPAKKPRVDSNDDITSLAKEVHSYHKKWMSAREDEPTMELLMDHTDKSEVRDQYYLMADVSRGEMHDFSRRGVLVQQKLLECLKTVDRSSLSANVLSAASCRIYNYSPDVQHLVDDVSSARNQFERVPAKPLSVEPTNRPAPIEEIEIGGHDAPPELEDDELPLPVAALEAEASENSRVVQEPFWENGFLRLGEQPSQQQPYVRTIQEARFIKVFKQKLGLAFTPDRILYSLTSQQDRPKRTRLVTEFAESLEPQGAVFSHVCEYSGVDLSWAAGGPLQPSIEAIYPFRMAGPKLTCHERPNVGLVAMALNLAKDCLGVLCLPLVALWLTIHDD